MTGRRDWDGVHGGVRMGTSLPELIVALILFGIVAGAITTALDRQARFHDGVGRVLEERAQLSAAHDALATELRAVASAAGDVESVTDSSIAYRAQVGSAVVCAVAPPTIDLAPDSVATGQRLGHHSSAPQVGDTAWLFDEGPSTSASDDRWIGLVVTRAVRLTNPCALSGFVDPVRDLGTSGWRLTLATPPTLPPTVAAGTVVRLTRRSRFALYRSSTGETSLGWSEWNVSTAAWDAMQPVSGPFVPYNRVQPAASGVALQGWDSTGASISAGTRAPRLARLGVMMRALSRGAVRIDGLPRGVRVDSLASTIGLRNWR